METLDNEILLELATNVFELMLEIPVEGVPASDYVSTIRISGSSSMQIELRAPEQTAKDIVSMMFMEEDEDLSESDICDALGEVTNMVRGNLKGLGNGESVLTLPCVSRLAESEEKQWCLRQPCWSTASACTLRGVSRSVEIIADNTSFGNWGQSRTGLSRLFSSAVRSPHIVTGLESTETLVETSSGEGRRGPRKSQGKPDCGNSNLGDPGEDFQAEPHTPIIRRIQLDP